MDQTIYNNHTKDRLLDMAEALDDVARILILYCLTRASKDALEDPREVQRIDEAPVLVVTELTHIYPNGTNALSRAPSGSMPSSKFRSADASYSDRSRT